MKNVGGFFVIWNIGNKLEGGVPAGTGWFEISSGSQDRVGFLHSPQNIWCL